MGISHLRSGGVDLPLEQTLGESLKLDRMINLVVTLRLGCKVGYADSDFDLSEKNVGHNLPHKVSVISVEMEVLNGRYIVVSCLGLRYEDSVWGAKPNSTAPLLPIYYLLYKGLW